MNIGIVGTQFGYATPFMQYGDCFILPDMDAVYAREPDVLVFTGGEDVTPSLYNEQPHFTTQHNRERDRFEERVYCWGKANGTPMCGICRGSQFLTVMNGGKLVQNISNHAHSLTHPIIDTAWGEYSITSTHHQMMYPFNLQRGEDYILLAYAKEQGTRYYGIPAGMAPPECDVEVLWFPKTKCLCVQGHPEYMEKTSDGWKYYQQLLKEYIF